MLLRPKANDNHDDRRICEAVTSVSQRTGTDSLQHTKGDLAELNSAIWEFVLLATPFPNLGCPTNQRACLKPL